MVFHPPKKTAEMAVAYGTKKVHLPFVSKVVLGFLAGAFISLGFLLDIRVTGDLPVEIWGSMSSFVGGAVFATGLILVLLAGGELVTGNIMTVAIARFAGEVKTIHMIKNWSILIITNFIGAIFVAYFFGHVLGLTETGPFLEKTIAIASSKIDDTFLQAFISGIGANWLVCLAVWLSYSAEDLAGKILGIWFPIMAFVAIGFQHVVANMFIIPAAIFAGYFSWWEYITNFAPVLFGNIVGGAIFVGVFYGIAYLKEQEV